MPPSLPPGSSRPARRPAWLAAPVLALVVATAPVLVASGCTGDDTTADGTSDSTIAAPDERSADDPLAFTAYADPAVPITAAVGERFALLLDAEPTEGFRWEVVGQADPAVVLPLGSQFVARDTLTAVTTTTTAPPPVPDPAAPPPGDPGADLGSSPEPGSGEQVEPLAVEPTVPEPTTTTVPTRSVQVLSYVARGPGRTTVTVRYVRIGAAADAPSPTTLTFTIDVPVPPPLF